MLLAIDIGNTNIEFGVFHDDVLRGQFRLSTNREITSDEVGLLLIQFFSIHGITAKDIEDVLISSVVPQIMYSISNAMRKYLNKTPLVVGENVFPNIENLYDNPKEVGADRLVNAVAAFGAYGGPLVVVDFGTATTFDVVSKTGAYVGGAIYPGLKISLDALFEKTAKLPRVELVPCSSVIGKNTVGSMQGGVLFGYAGAVRNIVRCITAEIGDTPKVIATGGLSRLIGQIEPGLFHAVDRTLTLDGLLMIYKNK